MVKVTSGYVVKRHYAERNSSDAHITGKKGISSNEAGVGVQTQTIVTAVILWNDLSKVSN